MVTDYIFPKFDFTENETNRNRRDQDEMTENEKKDQIKIERKRSILVVFLEIYGIFEIDISKFLKFV